MLRARIEQMLGEQRLEQGPQGLGVESKRKLWGWRGWAVAAVVIMGVGLAAYFAGREILGGEEKFPRQLAADMIATHDRCCLAKDHHRIKGVNGDDYVAMGQILTRHLKVPIISTAVAPWQFAGAGVCPVGGHPTAHYLYRHGAQAMSVFSIPAAVFSMNEEGENYDASQRGHELAGFVKSGGLYCVVVSASDGSATASQAKQLRDQLRDSFARATVTAWSGQGPGAGSAAAVAAAGGRWRLALTGLSAQGAEMELVPVFESWVAPAAPGATGAGGRAVSYLPSRDGIAYHPEP
ncbi:MAG: hypothetical protein ABR964_09465 [Tepidisphaeraceae bacterium]